MVRTSYIISVAFIAFLGCNEGMKHKIEVSRENEISKDSSFVAKDSLVEKKISIEKIAELANKGSLKDEFPKAKIQKEISSINEGMDQVKLIWLHRNTKDEVRIDFQPRDSTKVYRVTVEGRENKFYSETGVKLGMPLNELNSLNRKPVNFYGFEWDFGGAVQFNDGALEDKKLFIYLKTDKKYGKQFIGDMPHSSEDENAQALNLYVDKIIYEASKIVQKL